MVSSELEWLADTRLSRSLMVVALEGMFDAADAATTAVRLLAETAETSEPLARIDPEGFFNFQERRPEVYIAEGGSRDILWPENELQTAKIPGTERQLVLLDGVEPHLRWRTFAGLLVEVAQACKAEMVVTLGAMVGLAPHTRPLGVVGSSDNAGLVQHLGLSKPSYEGPTGLVGVLQVALESAGIPAISLRVSVPHYVPGPPNPEATRSLLRRFELVTGVPTGHEKLDQPAAEWRNRIDAAVIGDDELREYVQQLEQQVDEAEDLLPSGDDLAKQFEAFLRDQ